MKQFVRGLSKMSRAYNINYVKINEVSAEKDIPVYEDQLIKVYTITSDNEYSHQVII